MRWKSVTSLSFRTFSLAAIVALPIVLHFRAERRKRELDHIERMRAIEVGRSYPGELKNSLLAFPQWAVPHLMALSIGVVVPLGVFLFAFLATLIGGFHKDDLDRIRHGRARRRDLRHGPRQPAHSKMTSGDPMPTSSVRTSIPSQLIDEDAYDVVSSRG